MTDAGRIEEYRGVWVFCEQRDGQLVPTDFELVSQARILADERETEVVCLLPGNGVKGLAGELGGYGADRVIVCESPLLDVYTTDAYAKVVCDIVGRRKPEILLFGATAIGRDLAPRCAARLHTGLTADCTHLDVDMGKYLEFLRKSSTIDVDRTPFDLADRGLKMTRPAFGGHLMATIICPRFRPQMSTVRPGVLKKGAFDRKRAESCVVEEGSFSLEESDIRTKVIEVVRQMKTYTDITKADVIVSVGHGIGADAAKGLALAKELADALGGVVAGSRAAIDAGWLDAGLQVGQTGKTVRPKLYVALGISGAVQHLIGMQDAECVVAVNSNPGAPIFEVASFGICADVFDVLPLMIAEAAQRRPADGG